ncbi:MFS transporter [Nonomuraea typhae]|uniref:MFS transporter n=1 Tax=Nonomuraea typhae TaxID=2603600 RepID=UPI0012FB4236|nr:MFS transporter [Nonomuraea typhae]
MERHPRRWLILAVLCLCTLVLVVDNGVLTVAIPTLTRDLGATAQDIQWITASYILVFAGLLLTAGSLSDRFGRRRVMIIGLVVFGVASALATYAAGPGQLIIGRILMGLGGALVMPSTLSILITVFDDDERRRATSLWSSALMLGVIGGPVLGGVLISTFWWGSVFLINVPVAVVAIIAALAWMPESKAPARKADPPGVVLSALGMSALVWAIIELPRHGFAHPLVLTALGVGAVAMVTFVLWQARAPYPMVPLALFRDRNFTGGSLALVLVQVGTSGLLLALPQYLQFVLGYTPTQAGLAIAPMALATIAANAVGGALGNRIGNRPLAVIGIAVLATGFAFLATTSPGDGYGSVVTALVLFGVGTGLAQPAAVAALMGAVPHEHAGVGSALNDTMQQGGGALGVAVLGSVLASAFTAAMPDTATEHARRSISDALGVAARTADTALAETATTAFTTAMSVTSVAGGVLALAGAALAFLLIRDRKGLRAVPDIVSGTHH